MVEYNKYPQYKDSGVEWLGKIPVDWNVFKLRRSVSKINGGVWGEEPDIQEETIRCVRVADFDRHDSSIHSRNPTTRSYLKNEIIKKAAHDGDLIIEKSGGGEKTPVGNVVLYRGSIPIMYSNFVCKVSLSENQNSAFWCYMHKTLYGYGINLRSIKQNTGIQNLDIDSYFDEKVCFPPLATQNQIVSFLDAETRKIDDSVSSMESLISLLTEKRAALISETVTRGIPGEHTEFKDSGVEWLGEIPTSWDKISFGQLFKRIKTMGTGKEELLSVYREYGVIPKSSRSDNHNVASEDLSKYQIVRKNDLVINKMKSWQGSLAISEYDGIVSPAYFVFESKVKYKNNLKFLHYIMRSSSYKGFYSSISKGIRLGQWDLDQKSHKTMPILVPLINEQDRIVSFIEAELPKIDAIINEAKKSIELLKEKRQTLISDVVTGKIDVSVEKIL